MHDRYGAAAGDGSDDTRPRVVCATERSPSAAPRESAGDRARVRRWGDAVARAHLGLDREAAEFCVEASEDTPDHVAPLPRMAPLVNRSRVGTASRSPGFSRADGSSSQYGRSLRREDTPPVPRAPRSTTSGHTSRTRPFLSLGRRLTVCEKESGRLRYLRQRISAQVIGTRCAQCLRPQALRNQRHRPGWEF